MLNADFVFHVFRVVKMMWIHIMAIASIVFVIAATFAIIGFHIYVPHPYLLGCIFVYMVIAAIKLLYSVDDENDVRRWHK